MEMLSPSSGLLQCFIGFHGCDHSSFFNIDFIFVYLFLAALGLRCCASCIEQGLVFVAVRGLLTAETSLVAEHGL